MVQGTAEGHGIGRARHLSSERAKAQMRHSHLQGRRWHAGRQNLAQHQPRRRRLPPPAWPAGTGWAVQRKWRGCNSDARFNGRWEGSNPAAAKPSLTHLAHLWRRAAGLRASATAAAAAWRSLRHQVIGGLLQPLHLCRRRNSGTSRLAGHSATPAGALCCFSCRPPCAFRFAPPQRARPTPRRSPVRSGWSCGRAGARSRRGEMTQHTR